MSAGSMYSNAGTTFTVDGDVDEPFGQSILSADIQDVPVVLAQRLGFELVHHEGVGHRLSQSVPARSAVVLEFFVEAANVARQNGLNALQTSQLLHLMDSVLCSASPSSPDRSVDAAVSCWDGALSAVSAEHDALGVEAGTRARVFDAAMRAKLDAWAKETGPLQARHYQMLVAAVAGPDTRSRAAVTVRVPVELPLAMPPLADAQRAQ